MRDFHSGGFVLSCVIFIPGGMFSCVKLFPGGVLSFYHPRGCVIFLSFIPGGMLYFLPGGVLFRRCRCVGLSWWILEGVDYSHSVRIYKGPFFSLHYQNGRYVLRTALYELLFHTACKNNSYDFVHRHD